MPNIYNHTSYREFICDYYLEQKKLVPRFSYRKFADNAGFQTKTFIHKIIKGEKALSKSSTLKIAKAMGLKKKETDYFDAMVDFNNAERIEDKEYYFHNLQSLSKNHKSSVMRNNQFAYFNNWYTVVIRELVTTLDWKDDYKQLAKACDPAITPGQAKKSVTLLLDLGLLKKMPSGKYIQVDKAITAGGQVLGLAVKKFQKQALALASESIGHHKKENRDISTLTVGISRHGFERLRQELKVFRGKLVDIVYCDEPVDRVYQINFQLFPVSMLPKKRKTMRTIQG